VIQASVYGPALDVSFDWGVTQGHLDDLALQAFGYRSEVRFSSGQEHRRKDSNTPYRVLHGFRAGHGLMHAEAYPAFRGLNADETPGPLGTSPEPRTLRGPSSALVGARIRRWALRAGLRGVAGDRMAINMERA
jgi:hypothetical protein